MPMLKLEHRTEKNRTEIWKWIEEHLERELKYKVPREEFQIVESVNDCTFIIKGKNVGAQVHVADKLVSIELNIPLLFVPFKPMIDAGVRDALKEL